jgi:uncharacterized protein
MKKILLLCFMFTITAVNAQLPEKYQSLAFGSIKPAGWLKSQMQKDVKGFVGNLDRLVPDLIQDPIYTEGRLKKNSRAKDLGNLKSGDAEGEEQYRWWNSETQSNWWDSYIRNVFLIDDKMGIEKVKKYIDEILATQDADGYLGIYDPELRYQFNSENGELWAKTTLYRGLLAYYEFTKDEKVWKALLRAVDNVMKNYPINASQPFESGRKFNGGVSHGLTFTDVLDKMYQITHEKKYLDYAEFLYQSFSQTYQSEGDVQLPNILNPAYKLQSHGVHTFEHLRPLMVATYANANPELQKALNIYLARIQQVTTLTGGAIGDEWIAQRTADATHTGYEYCSLHELMDSYCLLLQKSGKPEIAELIEQVFYNAAQGARHPEHSGIAYLKTDNSFEMLGTKNGEIESNRKQTRYKYSSVHQDVAVCCAPNAGRITPYFVQNMWLKEGENTLVASLLGANVLGTTLQNTSIKIEQITEYPYQNEFTFKISLEKPLNFTLKIRKPTWAKSLKINSQYTENEGFIIIQKTFDTQETIKIIFEAEVKILQDAQAENYFSFGALIFAKPIAATEQKGKEYAPDFVDYYYQPQENARYAFVKNHQARFKNGSLWVKLKNQNTQKIEKVELIPFGKTILRQVSFK